MGGGPGYVIPAPYAGMSTWGAHTRRIPPSAEPGTDYYMPRGTPLVVPSDCRVVAVGGGIQPATGRFVTVDNGIRWIRYLHLLEQRVHVGQDLPAGTVFGLSGASGYGSEHFGAASDTDPAMIARTGGPHVHVTAFRGRGYTFGSAGTVDFHALTGGVVAGGSTPEDDVQLTDRIMVRGGTASVTVEEALARAFDVYDATFVGGMSMTDNGRPIKDSLAGIVQVVDRIALRQGQPVDAEVDENALALALAPRLAPLLADVIEQVPDEALAALVSAIPDEIDRRTALRDAAASAVDVTP